MAFQILGQKFHKITKKSSLYSQSLLIFIHKTTVFKNHSTTGEIRELLRPRLTPTKISLFLHELLAHLHTGNTQKKVSNTASDKDIKYIFEENKYIFVILWNLNVISHLIFPIFFFFISGMKAKNNSRGYVAF